MWLSMRSFIRLLIIRRLNQVLNNLREQIYRYRVEYLKDERQEIFWSKNMKKFTKQSVIVMWNRRRRFLQHIENQRMRRSYGLSVRETQNRQVHKIRTVSRSAHIKSYISGYSKRDA